MRINIPVKLVRTFSLFIILFLSSSLTFSQPNSNDLANAINNAKKTLENLSGKTEQEKLLALEKAIKLLAPYASSDREVARVLGVMDIERERRSVSVSLDNSLRELRTKNLSKNERERRLRNLRNGLLENSSHYNRLLDKTRIGLRDAQLISRNVKYFSKAIDDLGLLPKKQTFNNPQISAEVSEITKNLTRIRGILALAEGINDADAQKIIQGLRDSVSLLERRVSSLDVSVGPTSISAIDIPAEIAASQINTTRRGYDSVTRCLQFVSTAIYGDESALRDAIACTDNVRNILSSRTYGNGMMDALGRRVLDRFPFLRQVNTWFPLSGLAGDRWLVGRWISFCCYNGFETANTIVTFVRESNGTYSGYIAPNSPYAHENKFIGGEKVFKNYRFGKVKHPMFSNYISGGECKVSTYSKLGSNGEKKWRKVGGVIGIRKNTKKLHVPCLQHGDFQRMFVP